jgi:hypothetical protein
MEKLYFDDTTFIWKTKLNLFDNKNEIIKQAKHVIKSHIDNITDGFGYLTTENDKVLDIASCGNQPILDKIIELSTNYCKELYIKSNDYNKLNVESWINIVRSENPIQPTYVDRDLGGELRYHVHTKLNKITKSFFPHYTYVYYVQMPDVMNGEDGVLYFKSKNDITYWVKPEEDDLIIMTGDMPHVPNNSPNSTLDRIVIAGNVGFEFIKNFKTII